MSKSDRFFFFSFLLLWVFCSSQVLDALIREFKSMSKNSQMLDLLFSIFSLNFYAFLLPLPFFKKIYFILFFVSTVYTVLFLYYFLSE